MGCFMVVEATLTEGVMGLHEREAQHCWELGSDGDILGAWL